MSLLMKFKWAYFIVGLYVFVLDLRFNMKSMLIEHLISKLFYKPE